MADRPISAIAKLHRRCNNRCIFCHCHGDEADGPERLTATEILRGLPADVERVLLSGGEPTIARGVVPLMQELASTGLRVGLVTNGRMLAYPDFCSQALKSGGDYFYVSLHSHRPEVHDQITSTAGSFAQTVAGIRNLQRRAAEIDLQLNCVVVNANLELLPQLAELAARLGIERLKFSVPEIKGLAARRTADKLAPLSRAARLVQDGMRTARELGLDVAYDGLPYCVVEPAFRHAVSNLETERIFYMKELADERYFATDESARSKVDRCRDCSLDDVCTGFYRGYDQLGTLGVRAVAERIPNYFFLEPVLTADGGAGDCPFEPAAERPRLPLNDHRIGVVDGPRTTVYEARSKFFKRSNFQAALAARQVFVTADAEAPGTLSAESLRRLTLAPQCEACEQECAGLYLHGEQREFTRLSHRMTTVLAEVGGDVLDIGSGDLLLRGRVGGSAPPELRYTGLDPDRERCRRARRELPDATFIETEAEQMCFNPDQFDHVLMLGSYQHFRDLPAVLGQVRRVLREPATLVVIENGTFGLIAPRGAAASEQLAGAWGRSTGYAHYRNHDLAQARDALCRAGFSEVDAEDRSPQSNLWMIVAEQAGR